jgi:hypothetical protein
MPMPANQKMIRSRARTGTADAPCFQKVIFLFLTCYLLLKKLSKSLITLSDFPFALNRLPVFLGKTPCFREKTETDGFTMFVRRPGGCGRPRSSPVAVPGLRTNIVEPPASRASGESEGKGKGKGGLMREGLCASMTIRP